MRKILLTTAAAVALSTGALAADLPARAPALAPAPVFIASNWGGFYVGAQAGWSQFDNDAEVRAAGVRAAPGWAQGYRANGFIGGLYAGYNIQSGSMVYGLEIDANLNSASRTASSIGTLVFGPPDSARLRTPFEGALVGKLGFTVGNALIYALGGVSVAQTETRYNLINTLGLVQSNDDTRFGWTVGAGAAMKINPNWSARIEYRYANYGAETHALGASGFSVRHELATHRVMGGLTYHFGAPVGAVVAKY